MVKIYGGTGDADLYVKKGSAPTTSSYDCRPYTSGNTETCDMSSLGAGTYYIMVFGYRAVTGLTLERFDACATTNQGAYGGACASGKSGSHGTGTLSLSGGATAGVAKSATLHTIRTMPSSGDGLMSDQVAGFNWVAANKGSNISVINFSIGEDGIYTIQDNAITACVNAGVFIAVAAGNAMEAPALQPSWWALPPRAIRSLATRTGAPQWTFGLRVPVCDLRPIPPAPPSRLTVEPPSPHRSLRAWRRCIAGKTRVPPWPKSKLPSSAPPPAVSLPAIWAQPATWPLIYSCKALERAAGIPCATASRPPQPARATARPTVVVAPGLIAPLGRNRTYLPPGMQ